MLATTWLASPAIGAGRAPAPDLRVSSVATAPTAAAAGKLKVRVGLRNAGRSRAGASRLALRLSRGRTSAPGDVLLGSRSVPALRRAATKTLALVLTLPGQVAPGSFYVVACADARKAVRERDERNNCRASRTRVTVAGGPPAPAGTPPAPEPSLPAPGPVLEPTSVPPPDVVPPDTEITAGPSGTVQHDSASFEFRSTESLSTFECSLDGAAFASCVSPRALSGLALGTHRFEVTASDAAGNRDPTPAARTWMVEEPAPVPGGPSDPPAADPVAAAPSIDRTRATSFPDATRFLYSGADPIQKGVAAGAISADRVAVVRGRVRDRAGDPIGGVRITVLDHAELGRTATRADGGFDIAVNGGGSLVLRYQRAGYISLQRQVDVPWGDYVAVDEVVMIPYDAQVTAIDLNAPTPVQVARGGAVTDGDGARQATLMFSQGTTAEMVLPDGTRQPLADLHVRATEYSVGASGRQAMPAELPATSGYTYAVELSVDEAVAAGATDVRFDRPVIDYSENFLDFPVGAKVPTGYLDRVRGVWVPAPNGRVIGIAGETGGMADVTGANGLGVTDAERRRLAELYEPGQSLWRVPVTHFTPWDHNWPFAPPPDAVPPDPPAPFDNSPKPKKECLGNGSIVGCQSQRLGQAIGVAGTSFTLDYWSDRTPGRIEDRTLEIPLSGASVPGSLIDIKLEVFVAGRTFRQTFGSAPNLTHKFVWDGRDAYGRIVQGAQVVSIRLGYHYGLVPYSDPQDIEAAWSRTGTGDLITTPGVTPPRRMDFTVWNSYRDEAEGALGAWDARGQGLGGWSLNAHHVYDPTRRTVYLGDGGTIDTEPVITTAAGTGQAPAVPGQGDGARATAADLGYANDVAVAADGSVYVAEIPARDMGRLRHIKKDGTIETVAGGGLSNAEGIPAAQSRLGKMRGIAIGPDQSIYLVEEISGGEQRVRRIDAQGTIRTFAGGGTQFQVSGIPATQAGLAAVGDMAVAPDGSVYIPTGHLVWHVGLDGIITKAAGKPGTDVVGDGGPATEAALGFVNGVAVSRQGELYIGGGSPINRVRRVDAGGRISTVAGGASAGSGPGNGGPGTGAELGEPYGMDFAPDGSLYFAERNGMQVVRRLAPDGTITTEVGRPWAEVTQGPTPLGDRGPAARAVLGDVVGVSVAPDGSYYIATHGNANFTGRVRRVSRPLPKQQGGAGLIPSTDGREVYEFDEAGRHVRTRDVLTGATLLDFGYDGGGRLVTMTDAGGNVTTIERAGATPTAIVAPGGQRTTLGLNGDGWLESIAKPESQTTTMLFTPQGLMTRLTDPRGGAHLFEHDSAGRLTRDEAPDGAVQTLSRTGFQNGYKVTRTSALGRVSEFSVRRRSAGGLRLTSTDPSGAATVVDSLPDGSQVASYPDGSSAELQTGPDPRWDYAVPTLVSRKLRTLSGRTETTTQSNQATLSDPRDPFSFDAIVETQTSNGRTTMSRYDAATRRLRRTSPEGRQQDTVLDARGRVVRVEPGAGADALTYDYNARGLVSAVAQGPQSWTFERDARDRIDARIDAQGRRTEFARDDADRVMSMTSPSARTYSFGYDRSGNRTRVTMPDAGANALGYTAGDQFDRFTPAGSALSQTLAYNADQDLATTTLPGGRAVGHTFDSGGRVTAITYDEANVDVSYAGATRRPSAIDWTRAGGARQRLGFAYDSDLPTSIAFTGPADGTFNYTYDASRRLSAMSLSSGGTQIDAAVTRDQDGLATAFGPFTFARNGPGGAVSSIGDGTLAETLQHDGRGSVRSRSTEVTGQAVYGAVLTRDAAGRITRRVETVAGVATTLDYSHDADGRLLQVDRGGTPVERYAYDANGNRTSRRIDADAPVSLSYDAQDRLATRGTVAYSFDPAGFLRQRGADTFTYSARGELLSATAGSTTVSYGYDGFGRRTSRSQGADTTQYLYGNPGDPLQLTASRHPSGELTYYYYDEDGLLYALQRGGARFYVATDQVGSPRVVTDAAGAVVKTLAYDSFGNVLSDSAPAFDLPFGFAGGLADPVTGLVRFGLRDYEPESGRWTARDPILYKGGQANLYVYAGGDPVGQRDPSGLACIGGSIYAVFGGGGSLCITDEGLSLCAEAGLGFGTGADIDPTGDLAEAGTSVLAEVAFKFGPLGAKLGYELDSSGCLTGGPEAELGPVKLTPDGVTVKHDIDIETTAKDALFKNSRAGVQAKVAAKVCGNLAF